MNSLKLAKRRVVDATEFGESVIADLDDLVAKLYPNATKGTVMLSLPFIVTINKGKPCKCKPSCTEMPDGGTECNIVCTGDCGE